MEYRQNMYNQPSEYYPPAYYPEYYDNGYDGEYDPEYDYYDPGYEGKKASDTSDKKTAAYDNSLQEDDGDPEGEHDYEDEYLYPLTEE